MAQLETMPGEIPAKPVQAQPKQDESPATQQDGSAGQAEPPTTAPQPGRAEPPAVDKPGVSSEVETPVTPASPKPARDEAPTVDESGAAIPVEPPMKPSELQPAQDQPALVEGNDPADQVALPATAPRPQPRQDEPPVLEESEAAVLIEPPTMPVQPAPDEPPMEANGVAAPVEPARDPDFFVIEGVANNDLLNVREKASPGGRVLGRLPNGVELRNHGCGDINGARWCQVETLDEPKLAGWVAGRYMVETFVEGAALEPRAGADEAFENRLNDLRDGFHSVYSGLRSAARASADAPQGEALQKLKSDVAGFVGKLNSMVRDAESAADRTTAPTGAAISAYLEEGAVAGRVQATAPAATADHRPAEKLSLFGQIGALFQQHLEDL